jgi:hypothetical protein
MPYRSFSKMKLLWLDQKDNSMGKIFVSIWKIDSDQDYFDLRLILLPPDDTQKVVFELSGKCTNLDAGNMRINEFSVHRGASFARTLQYVLQQINNRFGFNKEVDEEGDGMREWISPADEGDMRMYFRSLFDNRIRLKQYS